MPSRDWRLRIQDIEESIDEILQRTADMEFEDFIANRTICMEMMAVKASTIVIFRSGNCLAFSIAAKYRSSVGLSRLADSKQLCVK